MKCTAYDPKTGNSYDASLKLNPDGPLRVTGCVLAVCRSKRWTRALRSGLRAGRRAERSRALPSLTGRGE